MLTTATALGTLSVIVAAQGPIPTVRVSAAQSHTKYAYWGAARGEIRARKRDGALTCVSTERASSDRRSYRLAESDAKGLADSERRHWCPEIGLVQESRAAAVLADLGL